MLLTSWYIPTTPKDNMAATDKKIWMVLPIRNNAEQGGVEGWVDGCSVPCIMPALDGLVRSIRIHQLKIKVVPLFQVVDILLVAFIHRLPAHIASRTLIHALRTWVDRCCFRACALANVYPSLFPSLQACVSCLSIRSSLTASEQDTQRWCQTLSWIRGFPHCHPASASAWRLSLIKYGSKMPCKMPDILVNCCHESEPFFAFPRGVT